MEEQKEVAPEQPKPFNEFAPVLQGPKGLGGWLILVGIGVVVSPLRLMYEAVELYWPIFRDGTFDELTNPASEIYHPLWGTVLLGEMFTNFLFFVASLLLLVWFFEKSVRFPRWYIIFVLTNIGFLFASAAALQLVMPELPFMEQSDIVDVAKAVIAAAVWVPYLLVSERVKNTFVPKPA